MKLSIRSLSLALLLVAAPAQGQIPPSRQAGQPVGFEETFALAEDRGAVLEQLLPGSPEHYFYSCLYLQQTGALDRAEALLERWREAGSRPHVPRGSLDTNQLLLLFRRSTQRRPLENST